VGTALLGANPESEAMSKENNPFERKDFFGQVIEEYSELSDDEADRLTLDQLRDGAPISPCHGTSSTTSFLNQRSKRQRCESCSKSGYTANAPDREHEEEEYLLRAERTGIADEGNIKLDRLPLCESRISTTATTTGGRRPRTADIESGAGVSSL
jgi:hypothetical protein